MADAAALIDVRGWVGERGGLLLCGPLDLTVLPGAVWHVEGPNGCGKTTLSGLREPAAARSTVLCTDLWWVGHASALTEDLDAALNLRLLLAVAGAPGLPADAAARHLTANGVPLGRPVRLLSAGQRRKLALSPLSLAPRRLWLLDEPFDALDTAACHALADLAARHVAGGGAIVLTSPLPADFPSSQKLPLRLPFPREQLSTQEHA